MSDGLANGYDLNDAPPSPYGHIPLERRIAPHRVGKNVFQWKLLRSKCNHEKHAKHPVDFMQERGFLL